MPPDERVLITGAGGFIGGRAAEVLYGREGWTVRAGLRRWSSAARIGRLPIEMVSCDVTKPAEVDSAMQGVTRVIHCAQGPGPIAVEGTRNVLAAAAAAGVARVVYLSTIDVYGKTTGICEEDAPLAPTGVEYGDTKIEAERLCRRAVEDGLPVAILRPTIVYGPFSTNWTVQYAERMRSGPWQVPPEFAGGICNLVYIDDLVDAIVLALTHDAAVGEAFNVNGGERVTWADYFDRLGRALGVSTEVPTRPQRTRTNAAVMGVVRKFASYSLKHFKTPIMKVYQRSDTAKIIMRRAEDVIRRAPTSAEFAFYSRSAVYPSTKAEKILGYTPRITVDEGVALCAAWLRHHGYAADAAA